MEKNLYTIRYVSKEIREAGVLAESKEEAIKLFNEGLYEDDDGVGSLGNDIKSIELEMENV